MALKPSLLSVALGAVALVLLLAGGYMIWNQGSEPVAPTPDAPALGVGGASTSGLATERPVYAPLTSREPVQAVSPSPVPNGELGPSPGVTAPPSVPLATANLGQTNWEEQINLLLESELDDTNIAFRLLALLPMMPAQEKVEATEHIVNLVPDENYEAVTPLVTNATTSVEMLDILISDLLLRPESVQLPLFLQMARNPVHPSREDGRDYLELYLGEDFGENWSAWEAAMRQWLADNPE